MTYTHRWYQSEAIAASIAFLTRPQKKSQTKKHGLVVLPTGSGKSLVISGIVRGLDAPAIIFQPSKEILEQNLAKLKAYGLNPSVCSASVGRKEIGDITLATIGSVKAMVQKDPELFARFRYILMDECDLLNPKTGMYKDFFAALGDITIIGFTATPYRLSTDSFGGAQLKFLTRTRPRVFNEMVYYVQNQDLFREGYLAKLEYHEVPGFDVSKLTKNTTGADYTDASVQRHFRATKFEAKIVDQVNRLLSGDLLTAPRKNVLVFTRFIAEAQSVKRMVPGAAIVTGETPKGERERVLAAFKAGEIRVVCNVGCLAVGFDYPELDTVVLARPTMSLRLYYQQIGRGLRPHPSKQSAWIIDMVGLVEQFGKVEDMVIEKDGNSKWLIRSQGRELTNVYFQDEAAVERNRFFARRNSAKGVAA